MTPTQRLAVARLRKVRELLARRGGWTQNTSSAVRPDGTWAYCLRGAINEVTSADSYRDRILLVDLILDQIGKFESVEDFNDNWKTRKRDILEVVDRAIESQEKTL